MIPLQFPAYAKCASVVMAGPNMICIYKKIFFHEVNVRLRPSQQRSHHQQSGFLHPCEWPILGNHCLFRALWSESRENADIWLWLVGHHNGESCQADCLIRMGVSWSDGSHKSNAPFHTISKIPWVIHVSAVVAVGMDQSVNDTHHNDPILKASLKDLGDKVVEQMAPPWLDCSVSPN